VLVYGEHKREVHGFEAETCADRMQLTAVINGLECLTRPVAVELWANGDYLRTGILSEFDDWPTDQFHLVDLTTAAREDDANADLWRRLESAAGRHTIRWMWADNGEASADCEHAAALAKREVEENEPAPGFDGPSIETAFDRFFEYRSEQVSERVLRQTEDFLGTFRWSVEWYHGQDAMGFAGAVITLALRADSP
jgi:ribonuclease HI